MYEENESMRERPWTPEESGLIAWFKTVLSQKKLPAKPFKLEPFRHVFVPERFYDMLEHECGTDHARTLRAIRRAVLFDLKALYFYVEGKEFSCEISPQNAPQVLFAEGGEGDAGTEANRATPLFGMSLFPE